ncbi:MAG TPA: hypothetical protein VGU67_02925 [Edaphobacter sp.]|nr:hypothetical protein [Edaphobacter sp.]
MSNTLVAVSSSNSRRQKTIKIKATPVGSYVAGGDVIDLTAITDPTFQGSCFPGSVPNVVQIDNTPAGYSAEIVAGSSAGLVAPGTVTPTPSTTGGTLAAGNYFYKVTALNAAGETTGSAEASTTTTGSTGSVALAWAAVSGATSYRVYRGTAAGAESVFYTTGTNSYTDTNAASTAGTVPTTNTTPSTPTLATAFKLKVFSAPGTELSAGAYPAALLADSFLLALTGPNWGF